MDRPCCSAALLIVLCLPVLGRAERTYPVPSLELEPAQRAAGRAITYLRKESAAWLSDRGCAACHHVAMPVWALAEARRQGYAIDDAFVSKTVESTMGSLEQMQAARIVPGPKDQPDPRPLARGVHMGAVFMAAAAESLPKLSDGQQQSVSQIEDEIIEKQHDDGSWDFYLSRPPINESQASDAAWMLMALQGNAARDGAAARQQALRKGLAWLFAQTGRADDPQLKSLKVILAVRSGEPRETWQADIDRLVALQRTDGGWSQTAKGPSDAFATGQALYALALAGYTADRLALRRAVQFLVATQKSDGSWPMTSRASPDGRPGAAKLLTPITCAATAWATLGLTRFAPQH